MENKPSKIMKQVIILKLWGPTCTQNMVNPLKTDSSCDKHFVQYRISTKTDFIKYKGQCEAYSNKHMSNLISSTLFRTVHIV